jgi:prepilin-type N-terminal cleavage/methylation domain-containing protein
MLKAIKRGFTLVELAVVSAILAGLAIAVIGYVSTTSTKVDDSMDTTVQKLNSGVSTAGLGDYPVNP